MYVTTLSTRCLRIAATTLFSYAALGSAQAASLVFFAFENDAGAFENAPAQIAPDLTAGLWHDLDATLTNFAGNPGRALAARSFDDGNSLIFTLTIAPSLRLTLDAIQFDQQASASGPKTWSLKLNGLALATGNTNSAFKTESPSFTPIDLSGITEIALAGTGASAGTGNLRIDNFRLSGSLAPVPIPGALLLFTPACALLARHSRRWV